MATENFTAANNADITSIGSSIWAYGNGSAGKLFVTDNRIRAILNENIAWFARRAGTFADDQYAQITLAKLAATSYVGVCVRANTSGTGYLLVATPTVYILVKRVGFSYVELRAAARTFNVNDILRLEVSGTTLTCKQNGTTFWTATDSAISSGNPGVSVWSPNALDFSAGDDWEGDDLSVTVTITDVNTNEIITSTQTNVVITGTGFGASQGTGKVEIIQGAVTVEQTIDSWADTSIQFDVVFDSGATDLKHGTASLKVTEDGGGSATQTITITINAPSGQMYIDLTSVYA